MEQASIVLKCGYQVWNTDYYKTKNLSSAVRLLNKLFFIIVDPKEFLFHEVGV